MVFALDTVRSNEMPNLNNMYNNERNSTNISDGDLPEAEFTFEVKIENDVRQVYRQIQKALTAYKDEKRGKFFKTFNVQFKNSYSTKPFQSYF